MAERTKVRGGGAKRKNVMKTSKKKKDAGSRPLHRLVSRLLDDIPMNWCDSLLTGQNAPLGKPPYNCRSIERMLLALKERMRKTANEGAKPQPR